MAVHKLYLAAEPPPDVRPFGWAQVTIFTSRCDNALRPRDNKHQLLRVCKHATIRPLSMLHSMAVAFIPQPLVD